MRILFALVLIACFASCQKENAGPNSTVVGKWNWTSTSGGWAPPDTPGTVGYTMTLTLDPNFKYTKYKNFAIIKTGTYRIEKQGDYDYMVFDSDPGLLINQPSFNVLHLGSSAADGPTYFYEKVSALAPKLPTW